MRNWNDNVVEPVLRPAARSVDAPRSTAHASRCRLHAPRSPAAFTLVELMTVILVISIVSGIVIAGAGYANRMAMKTRTQTTIQQVCTAIDRHDTDRGWYPPDLTCNSDGGALLGNQFVWPCEALWFWLEYWGPHQQYPKEPYMMFKREQLVAGTTKINAAFDQSAGNFMRIVDSWGNPLNYKSYNGNSYKFNDGTMMPRHNNRTTSTIWGLEAYDICSYGGDGTTWSDLNKPFDRQQDLSLSQMTTVTHWNGTDHGQIPIYFFKPFDTMVGGGGGTKHCYGGEDNDDINNWQRR